MRIMIDINDDVFETNEAEKLTNGQVVARQIRRVADAVECIEEMLDDEGGTHLDENEEAVIVWTCSPEDVFKDNKELTNA
jgi:hypothetical protein